MLPIIGVPTEHFTCPLPGEPQTCVVLSCLWGRWRLYSASQLLHSQLSASSQRTWAPKTTLYERPGDGKEALPSLPRDFSHTPLVCDLTHVPYLPRSYSALCNRKGWMKRCPRNLLILRFLEAILHHKVRSGKAFCNGKRKGLEQLIFSMVRWGEVTAADLETGLSSSASDSTVLGLWIRERACARMAQVMEVTNVGHCFISGSLWGSVRVFQQDEWEAIIIMPVTYQLPACCAGILVSYTDSTSVLFIGQLSWEKGITDCSCISNMVSFSSPGTYILAKEQSNHPLTKEPLVCF